MKPGIICTITTIQPPSFSVQLLSKKIPGSLAKIIIVGDKKGPRNYPLQGTELIDFQQQFSLGFKLAQKLPTNHYSRKNLGYLAAIEQKATGIYETDDDNFPMANWKVREYSTTAKRSNSISEWVNIYQYFSNEHIWPRGFPLDQIHQSDFILEDKTGVDVLNAPIQQGLVNGSPDVDAIWRFTMDREIIFNHGPDIFLPQGKWCPFNSQNTWWFPDAFMLMYLPSFCSFRMTDIWRSFVAQRCLWELDKGIVFYEADMHQKRNPHNLQEDFKDEVPGYLNNAKIATILSKLKLSQGQFEIGENLRSCYQLLVNKGIMDFKELDLVNTWIEDVNRALC